MEKRSESYVLLERKKHIMLISKPSVREKKLKKTNYETIVVVDASL